MNKKIIFLSFVIIPLGILCSCSEKQGLKEAKVMLNPLAGSSVRGTVTFTKTSGGMKIVADIEGLTPGKHGIHIHENGDCSAPDGSSAGGHFNPREKEHAGHESMNRHEGDLGNITADNNGKAHLDITDNVMTFEGTESILGKSVIVHEKEDDLKSQPSGNSGSRIACGIIEVSDKQSQ